MATGDIPSNTTGKGTLKLSDNELRDIIQRLEAGKPLPDKYRFLLFEDKREVELVWNGKTNEVCNIVLPFQTIEHVDEPRAEKPEDTAAQGSLFDERGRQLKGWTNKQWCEDITIIQSDARFDFAFVDQEGFEQYKPTSFGALLEGFTEYKHGDQEQTGS
ncbi:MAG: hypothetical protein H7829_13415 [Magnetococcus sp. THC-1_WYH]